MNFGKLTRIVSAFYLVGLVCSAQAQTTNLTQKILQMRTFREGLVWIGDQQPSDVENQKLLEVLEHLDKPAWTAGLERFLQEYPQSAWAASLHYDYASFCRRTGRTTKALEHYEAAWHLAKHDASPQGQRLGGAVLGNWMELLSSLGRSEQLKVLIAEGSQWHFVNPQDRDKFEGAKHSYALMQLHPGIAYRCGTFSLKAVGGIMQPGNQALEKLVELPSPTNGFSLAGLADLAKQYGLNMVAARRTAGQSLVVPSVVHWRQNHYAAILEIKNDLYRVSDPTFGRERWMSADVINEEASGEFLIPASSQTNGWMQLAANDAATIHGMGLPNNINDGKDKPCTRQFNGQTVCTRCPGMPEWWVSEPYINLWLADQPISYKTSRGTPVTFQLTYKQRDTRPSPNDYLISNAGWDNSWASYVELQADTSGFSPTVANSYATLYLPNGGAVEFSPGQLYDPETRLYLTQESGYLETGYDYGNNGVLVWHADGSQDIYGLVVNVPVPSGDPGEYQCLLTRHIDPNGDTTWFDYAAVNFSQYLLIDVLDPDGRTNSLAYYGNNLLMAVTNGYGQVAHFTYDSNANLTNIVDAQGLSSSIKYDTNGYPTALTTPYGTTTFSVYGNSTVDSTNDGEGNFGGHDLIDRSVQVTDPIGANYLYMYRYDCTSASPVDMATIYASSNVPTSSPIGTLDTGVGSSTNSLAGVCYRNSFYWGPRQFAGLSTTNMNGFVANDYLRGRMKHWLEDTNQLYLTGCLSSEQDPSPDGSTPGLLTFYDYLGKQSGYNFCAGSSALPSVKAWRLPNGETHYELLQFDYFGNITNDVTTYTQPNGGLGTRTNQFIYADNTYNFSIGTIGDDGGLYNTESLSYTVPDLLVRVIGADGNPIWSYGGFDTVTWTNYFFQYDQTNVTTLTSYRVLPDYTTNALGQVTASTYTAGGNQVTFCDLYPGTPSFPNYNYGTPIGWGFPGYSKVASTTTPAGLTTTNVYYTNGFLAQTIDLQINRTNSFGYAKDGLIGAVTNELGLNVSATWDNLLRLTSIQYPDGSYVSNAYTKLDVSGVRDRLGNWTQYVYDGARHMVYTTNANNAVTAYDWCGCGALTEIIDANTNITHFNYDNQGNLTNITLPDNSAINCQYNLAAWPTGFSDGAGRAFQVVYNNQGLATNLSSTTGTLQTISYDVLDRPVSSTDANGIAITNNYDELGELLTRTWPDGISERFGYSPAGLTAYTNRDNQPTYYGWDVAKRLITFTNANNETVHLAYDPASDITNLVDGLHHTTSWQYNQYRWLTNKIDGLNRNTFRFSYNANGWATNRLTPEKGNTGYMYDNVGNLKSIVYPQSTNTYEYNALNQLTNMVDAVGTNSFTYTPAGFLASETGPWTTNTISYAYSQGLRTNLILTQSGGAWQQSYAYDLLWRMTNVTSPAGVFAFGFYFNPVSSLVSAISLPNGAVVTNNYDGLARLIGTSLNNHWGHALDGYGYKFDPLGLRTNTLRNLGVTSSSANAGFDNIGQLISWGATETNGTSRLNEQLGFGYDAAHNLHARTNGALVQVFATDPANQLTNVTRSGTFTMNGAMPATATNITVNAQTAQVYGDFTFARASLTLANGNNTFTNFAQNLYGVATTNTFTMNLPASVNLNCDNNGNLTNDGTRTFGYDSENQLTNVFVPGQWRSDFIYDGLRRKRIVRDYGWSGSAWTLTNEVHYIYDGYSVIQERDANNRPLVTYTRGMDFSGSFQGSGGIGGLLARTDSNGATFYHADGSGNITALMDGNENIVARYLYNPYGKLLGQWGTLAGANTMQFSSMPQRRGIALYAFRGYDPNFQRWLNQDPIQERGGINLYRFIGNNPLNFIDLLGLAVFPADFVGPLLPGDSRGPLLSEGKLPPGYNPWWTTGTDQRGPYFEDPTGRKYWPDLKRPDRHWPHYDYKDPDGKNGRFPEKCEKPRPGQKQPPYGDQSNTDPWSQQNAASSDGSSSSAQQTGALAPSLFTPGVSGLPSYPAAFPASEAPVDLFEFAIP